VTTNDLGALASAVWRHYQAAWGVPVRRAKFRKEPFTLEIGKWDLIGTEKGVVVYATVGAGLVQASGEHRLEVVTGLAPECDAVAGVLASLAVTEGLIRLAHGSTINFGEPLWDGTGMSSFLVLKEDQVVEQVSLPDWTHCDFISAIPIFAAEREICEEQGVGLLFAAWERHRVQFWNPTRDPADLA
jgi:hypothetical protein